MPRTSIRRTAVVTLLDGWAAELARRARDPHGTRGRDPARYGPVTRQRAARRCASTEDRRKQCKRGCRRWPRSCPNPFGSLRQVKNQTTPQVSRSQEWCLFEGRGDGSSSARRRPSRASACPRAWTHARVLARGPLERSTPRHSHPHALLATARAASPTGEPPLLVPRHARGPTERRPSGGSGAASS